MTTQESAAKKTIHRGMTIEEILSMFPNKAQRLAHEITKAGLHCVGCHAATYETLEVGMMSHGMSDEQITALESALNALLQEESDPETISLTPRAAKKFLEFLAQDGKEGWAMRFGVKAGGCSGYEHELDFSEKAQTDDKIFESCGIQIHVNHSAVKYLLGAEIDFVEGMHNAGFKISNPNVRSSCGCGSSQNF